MNYIILESEHLASREEAIHYLAEKLSAPSWFGNNLDALWDLLEELEDTTLLLRGFCPRSEIPPVILSLLEEAETEVPTLFLLLAEIRSAPPVLHHLNPFKPSKRSLRYPEHLCLWKKEKLVAWAAMGPEEPHHLAVHWLEEGESIIFLLEDWLAKKGRP